VIQTLVLYLKEFTEGHNSGWKIEITKSWCYIRSVNSAI